jgi:hypothetical protein
MKLTPNDLDALRRAMKWGKAFQTREPQLRVWPEVLPDEGTPEWIKLAMYFVSAAQADNLHLKPWQCEPCNVIDDGVANPADCYGRRADEVTLLRRMLSLGVSRYEPHPLVAIAAAEAERAKNPDCEVRPCPSSRSAAPEPVAFRAKRTSNGR